MTILSRTEQKGRSMVEMLGVLAIIGVLSVGGISGYSKAMAKYKLTKAQDQITMLLMNIRTAFATSPTYSGFDTDMAAEFNIAPSDMVVTSGTGFVLNGAFGGTVDVGSCGSNQTSCKDLYPAGGSPDSYFFITMNNLGREACVSLATSDWGSDGMMGMAIAGSGTPQVYAAETLPLSLSLAGDKCTDSAEGSSITWVYY